MEFNKEIPKPKPEQSQKKCSRMDIVDPRLSPTLILILTLILTHPLTFDLGVCACSLFLKLVRANIEGCLRCFS